MRLTRLWSGQYEIVTGPLSPLRAADALVFTRETIVNIAAKHELHATFSPRVYKDTCNFPTSPLKTRSLSCVGHRRHRSAYARIRTSHSSASCKSSSRKSEHKQKTTMTPLERSFLQSLLENLPFSTAYLLPTAASYDRVRDGIWSFGTYACWGRDNREAAVRLTGPPGAHHLEVRAMDGTANPYIAFAAVLGQGLIGIEKGGELSIDEVEGLAVDLSAEERARRGVHSLFPTTLAAARRLAQVDTPIKDVLGKEFVQNYLSVNEVREYLTRAREW